jgi:leucyl aminopeptidase
MHSAYAGGGEAAIPIWFVTTASYGEVREHLNAPARAFADAAGYEPKAGRHLLLPGAGALSGVLFGLDAADKTGRDRFLPGRLPGLLPAGTYRFANATDDPSLAALAFALGAYRFGRYRTVEDKAVRLVVPDGTDGADLSRVADGVTLARDLINTPANDMGPAELEEAARALATKHGASVRAIVGDDLLGENFPLIHAVGRAAARAPRLIDIAWARACASTPAGSTSSQTAACSS